MGATQNFFTADKNREETNSNKSAMDDKKMNWLHSRSLNYNPLASMDWPLWESNHRRDG
jgi:hypothetical protein